MSGMTGAPSVPEQALSFVPNIILIYICPPFPAKVTSTLGAGDAFASTFCATIDKFNYNVELALKYGTINSASVCEHFGAQDGFLTYEEMDEKIKQNPDFQVKVIEE